MIAPPRDYHLLELASSDLPLELAPRTRPSDLPPPYAMASARISNGWRTFFEVDISICHLQVSQSVET